MRDELSVGKQRVFLAVEQNGIGLGESAPKLWVFADGINNFGELYEGVWTIQHFNGTLVHVPVGVLTEHDVEFLRSRGQHSEDIVPRAG